jgi:hypothetical protein
MTNGLLPQSKVIYFPIIFRYVEQVRSVVKFMYSNTLGRISKAKMERKLLKGCSEIALSNFIIPEVKLNGGNLQIAYKKYMANI